MQFTSVKFQGHRCFKKEWAGFDTIKPINVIIGRNNSGKSHLLDLVETMCAGDLFSRKNWRISVAGKFTEAALKTKFQPGASGGGIYGDHWNDHGRHLVNLEVEGVVENGPNIVEINFKEVAGPARGLQLPLTRNDHYTIRFGWLKEIFVKTHSTLSGRAFRRIGAERNIVPEGANRALDLKPDGRGATNIVRRHLKSSHVSCPPERIEQTLRNALNEIFGADGHFTAVGAVHHDEPTEADQTHDTWEIYLTEEKKGRVALSRSGSGIKTVILVLLNLLIIPELDSRQKGQYVFAFEELENNLHPALLRRLFRFIEAYVKEHNATVFLTTHSSVALDVFGVSPHAQIIHVTHDGESAYTRTISAHFERTGVIAELGAKPSDLLQANCVVWVEGPSDRIYLNRWLDLASGGKLKEGRDYICAFYGGALLASDQFSSPEDANPEFSNLLRVNNNIVVVCDSDRTAETGAGSELKGRVARVKKELEKIPSGYLWVTGVKEIENYLPEATVRKVFKNAKLEAPGRWQRFFPSEKDDDSYVERQLGRKTMDKVDLASRAVSEMTVESLGSRFDWADQIKAVVERISQWNK